MTATDSPRPALRPAPPLTRTQARRLTDRIIRAADEMWALLAEAHEARAWDALGYTSWKQYVETEFEISRGHASHLLDRAYVLGELTTAAGVSRARDISKGVSARQAVAVKHDLPAVVSEVASRIKAEPGADPTVVVADVVKKAATRARSTEVTPRSTEVTPRFKTGGAVGSRGGLPVMVPEPSAASDVGGEAGPAVADGEGMNAAKKRARRAPKPVASAVGAVPDPPQEPSPTPTPDVTKPPYAKASPGTPPTPLLDRAGVTAPRDNEDELRLLGGESSPGYRSETQPLPAEQPGRIIGQPGPPYIFPSLPSPPRTAGQLVRVLLDTLADLDPAAAEEQLDDEEFVIVSEWFGTLAGLRGNRRETERKAAGQTTGGAGGDVDDRCGHPRSAVTPGGAGKGHCFLCDHDVEMSEVGA